MFELGNSLREARLRRRLDLVDAEQDTKIRSKYLAALENETFDVLPGSVFARGFLRTYARYLGLDSQLYVDEFNARFGAFEDEEPEPATSTVSLERAGRRRVRFRSVVIASLVAFAIVAYLGLRADQRVQQDKDATLDKTKASITAPDPEPNFAESPSPAVAPATRTTPAADSAGAATVASAVRVSVVAVGGASWIEVRRATATGEVLFAGELAQGEAKVFRGKRLHVRMGYPSALELRQRGKAAFAPTTSDAMSVVVTPAGIKRA